MSVIFRRHFRRCFVESWLLSSFVHKRPLRRRQSLRILLKQLFVLLFKLTCNSSMHLKNFLLLLFILWLRSYVLLHALIRLSEKPNHKRDIFIIPVLKPKRFQFFYVSFQTERKKSNYLLPLRIKFQ